jgi:hypothetical protein
MSKITAEHLARTAYVYIRQSTPDQLVHNLESQRRQYALAERARQLGWTSVREEGIELPAKAHDADGRYIVWKLPLYNTVHNILTNPAMPAPMPSGARRARRSSRMAASGCGAD